MKNEYFWLIQSLCYWSVAFFLIPWRTMVKLAPFSFVGGFVYTIFVQILAVIVFKKWNFSPDILTIAGIPFFFVWCWFGVIMCYGYLLLRYPRYQALMVLGFACMGTLLNFLGGRYRMLAMHGWSLLDTFMFAVFSHILILFLFKWIFPPENLRA
jgi:hypothetical protein